jgi:serine/threonine protein kinase
MINIEKLRNSNISSYTSSNSDNSSSIDSDITESSDIDYSQNGDELIGEVINNKFFLLYKIGYGSFSSVWLTYDISDDNFYAMKIQTPNDYDEGIQELKIYDMIQKICKENESLMTIKQYFIMVKDEKKYVCMLMDLMAGTLYDVIKTDKYNNGLPSESVKKVETQLMDAIKILHNFDIIHTDIKPENILVYGINKKYQKIIDKFKKLNLKEKFDENLKILKEKYNLKNKRQKEKFKKVKYLILLELNKHIHEIIDFNEILSDRTSDLFTEDQINNIKIKLADFGSILYESQLKKENWYPEITTRYYRDPRVILGLPYDKTVDIFSAKCTLHEVEYAKIKYNPDLLKEEEEDENNYSTDYYHLLLLLNDGIIKKNLLKKCKKDELKDDIKNLLKI